MDFSVFRDLLESVREVEVRTHENADADAVASALALKFFLERLSKRVSVSCPESVSRIGSILAEFAEAEVEITEKPSARDLVIYVDSKPTETLGCALAVIDHHQGNLRVPVSFSAIDANASSSSEIVFRLLRQALSRGWIDNIPKKIGLLLMGGIIADTGDLRLSRAPALRCIAEISDLCGAEPFEAFSLLKTPPDRSLKIACLKGASRMRLRMTRGYLIAITQVSSFQGDVASSLIHLGADVAFAAGRRKDVLQASGRARMELVEMGLNLAEVMSEVAGQFGGDGGGHAGAAAMKGHGEPQEVLEACVSSTKRMIRQIITKQQSNLN